MNALDSDPTRPGSGGEGATTTTQFGEASPPEPGLVGSESNAFIPIDYEKSLGCPG